MNDWLTYEYRIFNNRRIWFIIGVFICLLVVAQLALLSGSADIGIKDVLSMWTGKADALSYQVILNIRLPRIIGAILSGMALAVSGGVIQSLLRNPLASPFTLGISGSAAFGAAFAIIILGAGTSYNGSDDVSIVDNPYLVAGSAFIWSLVSVTVILMLSRYRGATPEIIILSGIIISSLFGAGISAMQYFADSVQLSSIVFWTFGDLGRATWKDTVIQSAVVMPALIFFFRQSWNYKSLQAGDEYAKSLGVKPERVRLAGMVLSSLVTAVIVSFYGVIAFVGLVVPHIVRRIIGGDELFLLPASAIFGGMFLLLSDTLARTVISPVILPVGILTSFLGAPLFLFLLIKGIGIGYWK
ncbi:MAG: iron ABC transporter permease [Bacteroidales bacterium]